MNPCPFSCDQSRAEERLWRAVSKLQASDSLPDRGVTTTALQVFYYKLCYCIKENIENIEIIETLILIFLSLASFPERIFAERFPANSSAHINFLIFETKVVFPICQ